MVRYASRDRDGAERVQRTSPAAPRAARPAPVRVREGVGEWIVEVRDPQSRRWVRVALVYSKRFVNGFVAMCKAVIQEGVE